MVLVAGVGRVLAGADEADWKYPLSRFLTPKAVVTASKAVVESSTLSKAQNKGGRPQEITDANKQKAKLARLKAVGFEDTSYRILSSRAKWSGSFQRIVQLILQLHLLTRCTIKLQKTCCIFKCKGIR